MSDQDAAVQAVTRMVLAHLQPLLPRLAREAIAYAADGALGIPTVRTGTCALGLPGESVDVTLDGDVNSVVGQNITGSAIPAGQRVSVLLVPPHGILVFGFAGSLARIGCALAVSGQSIPTAADTRVSFDVEVYDPQGFVAVPSGTITVPPGLDGIYDLTYIAGWSLGVTGRCFTDINVSAAPFTNPTARTSPGSAADYQQHAVSLSGVPLSAGDTISYDEFHSTGVNRTLVGGVSIYRVAS